jgi:hypothetical protein
MNQISVRSPTDNVLPFQPIRQGGKHTIWRTKDQHKTSLSRYIPGI